MLLALMFSLLCRSDVVRIAFLPADSVLVRPSSVAQSSAGPRRVALRVLGRPIFFRFAPRRVTGSATARDSVAAGATARADSLAHALASARADSLAAAARRAPPACTAFDLSPRLRLPALGRGGDAVRIEYGVGVWGARSRLEIFDVAGRRVASLSVAEPSPGRGVTWWQRPAGPGVYFARLSRPDAVLTRRIVLVS